MGKQSKVLVSAPLIIMIVILFASSVNTYAATPEKKITVAGDAQFPPYEFVDYIDGKQEYRGFNVDILKALGLETGYEIDFQPMVWADALAALDKGQVDVIEGMKYDRSRVQKYDFSEEYIINSQAIFVLKDMHVISDENDLIGHKIAVEADDIAFQKLQSKNGIELVPTKDLNDALSFLDQGKVDAVVGNKLTGEYILQRAGITDKIKIVGSPIDPEKYCVAVKKGNTALLSVINEGLLQIKRNGTYDKIYAKWFGQTVDYPASFYKKYLIVALVILSLFALVVVAFLRLNHILKREVKKRTQEIERVTKELERKDRMEALGNLVASIAHEIRTPLTSIKTFTELIPLKYDNPAFREKISKYVPEEIERLNAIINDLLNYAKPRKAIKEFISVKELIKNTLILFNEHIEDKHVGLNIDVDDKINIFVDQLQIKQVLVNVILNALQAIEEKAEASLKISCRTNSSDIVLEITDNGSGIPENISSRIFEPFFTTKKGGTGLGLFISYRLVRENGGDILVHSLEGFGTTMCIKFPALNYEGV